MRKVILFMLTSLDGYFEGSNQDINWHNVDEEFNEFAIEQLGTADTLLFGRVTYELMASYWPTPEAIKNDPIVAGLMNSKEKIVFSRNLEKVEWENTRLVKDHIGEEIARLKALPGKDIYIFGSSNLSVALMQQDLVDEFRIMVNPIVLGGGKTLFQGISGRVKLKLSTMKTFRNGNVLLGYVREEAEMK